MNPPQRTPAFAFFLVLLLLIASGGVPVHAADHGVKIQVVLTRWVFNPTNLVINAGDRVIWTNLHSTAHDATHKPAAGGALWASGNIAVGATFPFTFNNPGSYPYHCQQHAASHPEQTGTVSVVSANLPPSISLTNPANGAKFFAPATIELKAAASDSDGSVSQVRFNSGVNSVGVDSSSPYSITASNLAAGSYAFTAIATDNQDSSAISSVVNVTVFAPPIIKADTLERLPNGRFRFVVRGGSAGQTALIQASGDLAGWTSISTNVFPPTVCPTCPFIDFIDEAGPGLDQRIYRIQVFP